jgi:hypothetical protein
MAKAVAVEDKHRVVLSPFTAKRLLGILTQLAGEL